ncbi:hypothetical protein HK098_005176 [Nowakowskiella sp. JEL0407]|nr:hypothetical protein HK098_005176 [Nowakowskiella sp. JEL0407]
MTHSPSFLPSSLSSLQVKLQKVDPDFFDRLSSEPIPVPPRKEWLPFSRHPSVKRQHRKSVDWVLGFFQGTNGDNNINAETTQTSDVGRVGNGKSSGSAKSSKRNSFANLIIPKKRRESSADLRGDGIVDPPNGPPVLPQLNVVNQYEKSNVLITPPASPTLEQKKKEEEWLSQYKFEQKRYSQNLATSASSPAMMEFHQNSQVKDGDKGVERSQVSKSMLFEQDQVIPKDIDAHTKISRNNENYGSQSPYLELAGIPDTSNNRASFLDEFIDFLPSSEPMRVTEKVSTGEERVQFDTSYSDSECESPPTPCEDLKFSSSVDTVYTTSSQPDRHSPPNAYTPYTPQKHCSTPPLVQPEILHRLSLVSSPVIPSSSPHKHSPSNSESHTSFRSSPVISSYVSSPVSNNYSPTAGYNTLNKFSSSSSSPVGSYNHSPALSEKTEACSPPNNNYLKPPLAPPEMTNSKSLPSNSLHQLFRNVEMKHSTSQKDLTEYSKVIEIAAGGELKRPRSDPFMKAFHPLIRAINESKEEKAARTVIVNENGRKTPSRKSTIRRNRDSSSSSRRKSTSGIEITESTYELEFDRPKWQKRLSGFSNTYEKIGDGVYELILRDGEEKVISRVFVDEKYL